uniref:Progestin and adipoQ receptor family member 3 n=1 Tax=Athene cunicularia TaxID=194338 RepID=A0A663MQ15_ATHCN
MQMWPCSFAYCLHTWPQGLGLGLSGPVFLAGQFGVIISDSVLPSVCMLCSVGYHLFCCHRSEKTSRRWMALDYAGISIGILGCYVSGVFYAFYCNNYWRQVYLITVLAMILAVFFAQIHPSYLTQQWHRLRSIIFCSVSGYGIIPTIHWVWLNGGIGASIVQEFAPRVVVMYFIAAVAFLFYISKVPERYFPGRTFSSGCFFCS